MQFHQTNQLHAKHERVLAALAAQWSESLLKTFASYGMYYDASSLQADAQPLFQAIYILHCAYMAKTPTPTLVTRLHPNTTDSAVLLTGRGKAGSGFELVTVSCFYIKRDD
jgi:hypothetical protein